VKRAILAAIALLAILGVLCLAWYASSERALAAELRGREQTIERTAADGERMTAERLARKLEELRHDETQRPYFHYQNLYHDPKGVSEGLSVVPSPLATGSSNPLISTYFQIENSGRVTLPTLNEDVSELNMSNAAEQRSIRDKLTRSSQEMREAAAPLVALLSSDDARTRATDERIAELEERLAASQAEAARRRATVSQVAAPQGTAKQQTPLQKKVVDKIAKKEVETGQQSQYIDPSAFRQNVSANDVYIELKNRAANPPPALDQRANQADEPANAPVQTANVEPQIAQSPAANSSTLNVVTPNPEPRAPTPQPRPRRERPVEIRTTDLEWRTITIESKPRLVALRGVLTPNGSFVQGIVTPLAEGEPLEGAIVRRAKGTAIEGTGWRVRVDPAQTLTTARRDHEREIERFHRTFAGVTALLLFVVAGIVWMVSRAETLAVQKSRFAATAAHELRTPLASLRLYADMIADERDPARRERYAREISGQTERLGRLVANVLEVTRIERGTFRLQRREGNIGPAIEACVEKLRPQMEASGCPVDLRVEPNLPVVAFDADALHHIVDNLLDNAEKYSRDTPERNVSVAVAPEDGGVSITVRDRGPGLPDKVFRDPHPFRHSSGGLGLGLFLVDRIVRAHGGAIRSTAAPGGGANIHVFLPAFYKA